MVWKMDEYLNLCQAELNIQVWSKEKLDWSQKAVGMRFPSYFSIFTGCAVDIGKYHVLFIGGHHTSIISYYLEPNIVYPIQTSINDQVIEYDFKNATWKSLSELPLSVRVGDIIYTFNLKIISKITTSHPNLPVQIAVLLTGKFR